MKFALSTLAARLPFYCITLLLIVSCTDTPPQPDTTKVSITRPSSLVITEANSATQSLYRNLYRLRHEGVLFGHQDSLAYGVEWSGEPDQSDIKRVTGDYPALYGWDIGHLELGDAENLDGVSFAEMQHFIKESFERGGVNTISWHMTSPVTGESSWEKQPTVHLLVPGAPHHDKLIDYLDRFASFAQELTYIDDAGDIQLIPLIFRPWHEHNGDWFWWSKNYTSEQDYIALWRFTVDYLRHQKKLDNLIFAYSPDRSRIDLPQFDVDYNWGYPGDSYVDVIGLDNYWDLGLVHNPASPARMQQDLITSLTQLAQLADSKNKLAALTEGGQENLPHNQFWTERLLAALLANESTRSIAYVQVWRNANRDRENRDHFYAPFPGHSSAPDFVQFYKHPFTWFEDDLPDLYGR